MGPVRATALRAPRGRSRRAPTAPDGARKPGVAEPRARHDRDRGAAGRAASLGLHRRTRLVSGPQGPHVLLDGKPVLLLCSNNYLGPGRPSGGPRGGGRRGDALGRRRGRLAAGVGHDDDPPPARGAAGGVRATRERRRVRVGIPRQLGRHRRRWPGPATSSSPISSTTPRSSTAAGCRGPRSSSTTTATPSTCGGASTRGRGRRGALIVTDSVFSMDGDVAPLAETRRARRSGTAAHAGVDEAHATGVLGPAGAAPLAEAGLEDQVDVIVGTLGKALGSYGAFVASDRAMARYLVNVARTFMFSTALPPPAVAAALAALGLLEERATAGQQAAGQRAALRAGAGRRGRSTVGAVARRQILPLVIGEAGSGDGDAARRRCARRVRAGDPPADRAADDVAAAVGRDGDAPRGGAARGGADDRRRRPSGRVAERAPGSGARGGRRSRPTTGPSPAAARAARVDFGCRLSADYCGRSRRPLRGCFVTGTDTGVGKTRADGRDRRLAGGRAAMPCARSSRSSPGSTSRPADWPPDHELLALVAGCRPEEVVLVGYGPPVSPHLALAPRAGVSLTAAALLAGCPARCGREGAARRRGRRRACSSRSIDDWQRPRSGRRPRAAGARRRPPRASGTINHTLLTLEAARARPTCDVAGVVLTPWPDAPGRDASARICETIGRLGRRSRCDDAGVDRRAPTRSCSPRRPPGCRSPRSTRRAPRAPRFRRRAFVRTAD